MWWIIFGVATIVALPFLAEWRRWPMNSVARNTASGQFIELSQGVTHYQWHGPVRGPVAVCIHGLSTPGFVWDGIVGGLALCGFRVLTYDLYGRGFSDRPKGAQDRAFFLKQLGDLLAELAVEDDVTVVGYSMGGSIATCFAAEQLHRIRRLILIAPAGLVFKASRFADFTTHTPIVGDWVMRVFGGLYLRRGKRSKTGVDPERLLQMADESRTRGYLDAVLSSQRHFLERDLTEDHRLISRAGIPVLAIWGTEDAVIPIGAMGKLAEVNREAHQVAIKGADHWVPQTHPQAVIEAIQQFVREL